MAMEIVEDAWFRSRRCESGACVESARVGDTFALRDSTDPDPILRFARGEWAAFTAGIRAGEFDLPDRD